MAIDQYLNIHSSIFIIIIYSSMASKPVAQLSIAERDQLAVSYAAFVLSGQGAQVNPESLETVLKAANIDVSANLVRAVGKALTGRNVNDFFGSCASTPASSSTEPVAEKPKEKQEEKQPEKPKEPEVEDEEMDMGGLFD